MSRTKGKSPKATKVYDFLNAEGELIYRGTIKNMSKDLNLTESYLRRRVDEDSHSETLEYYGVSLYLYEYWNKGELVMKDSLENIAKYLNTNKVNVSVLMTRPSKYERVYALDEQRIFEDKNNYLHQKSDEDDAVKVVKMVKAKKHKWNPKGRYVNFLHDKYFEKWDSVINV